jgi:hypothetical protein
MELSNKLPELKRLEIITPYELSLSALSSLFEWQHFETLTG